MAQASIHFEPVKEGSEEHNKRQKFLDYVHPERTHLNEYWESDTQKHRLDVITQNFLDHHPKRKKLHAKATPIREAVVNIEEGTTMSDLKELARRLKERFGIEIFQIAIHRDEGYKKSADRIKLNLHAHLVADWTDHSKGESLKLNRQDMAVMQTINAECLEMERGASSDKKHLTAMQYKEKKAREEAEKAVKQKDAITAKCVEALRTNGQLVRQIEEFEREKRETFQEVENLRSESVLLSNAVHRLRITRKSLTDDISGLETQKEEIGSQAESLANVVQAARSDLSHLNEQKMSLSGEVLNLRQERDKAEQETKAAQERMKEAEIIAMRKINKAVADVAKAPKTQSLEQAQKAGSIWKQMIYAIWESASAAVDVLLKYLYYPHLNVSFGRDEVRAIDNAMRSAQTIEERKAYGRDLVKLANAEFPGYAQDSTKIWELNHKVEQIADRSNRWMQEQDRSQSQGWHL